MQTDKREDISKIMLMVDYLRLEAVRLKLSKTEEHCKLLLRVIRDEQEKFEDA